MTTYAAWAGGQPNNAGYGANGYNYEDCVFKTPGTAGMNDVGCGGSYRYVCKDMRGWLLASLQLLACDLSYEVPRCSDRGGRVVLARSRWGSNQGSWPGCGRSTAQAHRTQDTAPKQCSKRVAEAAHAPPESLEASTCCAAGHMPAQQLGRCRGSKGSRAGHWRPRPLLLPPPSQLMRAHEPWTARPLRLPRQALSRPTTGPRHASQAATPTTRRRPCPPW
jgi:hypothetical protein